jgi:hypothetical protein
LDGPVPFPTVARKPTALSRLLAFFAGPAFFARPDAVLVLTLDVSFVAAFGVLLIVPQSLHATLSLPLNATTILLSTLRPCVPP